MTIKSFRDLDAWKRAMEVVKAVYRITETFPSKEQFGLTSQMRRAAVSFPANIAEGKGRTHKGDYLHHLSMARGPAAELETLLELAVELGFADRTASRQLWQDLQEPGRLLSGLIRSISRTEVVDTRRTSR